MSWHRQNLLKNMTKQSPIFHMYLFVCRYRDLDKVCSKIRQNKIIYFICIYLSVCVLTSTKSAQKYDKVIYVLCIYLSVGVLTSTKSADTNTTKQSPIFHMYLFVCMCLDLGKVCSKIRQNKVIYFICIYCLYVSWPRQNLQTRVYVPTLFLQTILHCLVSMWISTVTEYQCHKWPRICSICCNHNSSFPHSIYIWNQFDNTIFSIFRIFCFTIFASLIVRCFWSYKTY